MKCGVSTVQTSTLLVIAGVKHAGVVTHICSNPSGHEGRCMCECGYNWTKFHTEKGKVVS
jgi:hypothetical protein